MKQSKYNPHGLTNILWPQNDDPLKGKEAILSEEEREVLVTAAQHPGTKHLSNREIAQRLNIPVTKVKTLIHQACNKLDCCNKNEAILQAMRMGEINLDELLPLHEIAEILCSLDPKALRLIANLVRRNVTPENLPEKSEAVIRRKKRQSGILTNRERDVLILASYGLSNEEIADKLCISANSVRTFLNRSFTKLGARKRADAIQLALKKREICVGEISSLEELVFYLTPLGADAIEKIASLLENKESEGPASLAG